MEPTRGDRSPRHVRRAPAIEIRVDAGEILLRVVPYDPALVSRVKEIPGRRWDPSRRVWRVPGTPEVREAVLREFGSEAIAAQDEERSPAVPLLAEDSATGVTGSSLLSFNRDGTYPSVVLATERDPPGDRSALVHQQIIFNDHGRLSLKTLADYPVNARDVDCRWLKTNDLPVCFYASYGPDLGRTKLIEIDPNGLRQMAADTAYLNLRYRVSGLYDGWVVPGHPDARQQAMAWGRSSLGTVDSLLATGWADAADSFVDSVRAISLGLSDRLQMYSTDITREYRLPWPVELSRAHNRERHPRGQWMDGYMMVGSVFLDLIGDGLLDLVSVGQHSGVFSARLGRQNMSDEDQASRLAAHPR